jgi:hypothetical protein
MTVLNPSPREGRDTGQRPAVYTLGDKPLAHGSSPGLESCRIMTPLLVPGALGLATWRPDGVHGLPLHRDGTA